VRFRVPPYLSRRAGHVIAGSLANVAAIGLSMPMALCLLGSPALAQAPELGGLLPAGGPRGATTRIQIDGKNLQGARLFLVGRGVKVAAVHVSATGDSLAADVTVDPAAPLGPHDVRIATAKGVSNGARFWVDVLPNRVIEKPMVESDPPVSIDGSAPAVINSRIVAKGGRDRFLITANAGEIWSFQCLADEIRSRMDPILDIRDEAGVSLRLVESTWESNPRFAYKFAKSGRYLLTVRDSEYNGGPNYTYRLLAAKAPFVSGYSPRGARPGERVEVALEGVNLPTERASVAVPKDAAGEYWADLIAGSSGSIVLPLMVEPEPVTSAGDQDAVRPLPTLPAAIDGWFGRAARATFSFQAAAGGKYVFDLLGRRIGSRIDGALRVIDSAGKEVGANDDAAGLGKDARLEFTAPAAGTYRVEVSNVEEITGPNCYYRLRAYPVVPDFDVSIATDRLTVPAAGTVALPITLERLGGFAGPVTVRCDGLPPGVTFRGGLIPPGKTTIEATLTGEPGVAVTASQVHLIAEATIGGHVVEREAPAWERYEHRSIDLLLSVEYSYTRPHHIWDLLLLGVTDRTDPITVSSSAAALTLKRGGSVEVPIHVLRHPGTQGEIKLDVRGLPGKVTASGAAIAANQTDGRVTLTAAADAPLDIAGIIVQAHLGSAVALLPSIQLTVSKP
jgi:hypothetical protein